MAGWWHVGSVVGLWACGAVQVPSSELLVAPKATASASAIVGASVDASLTAPWPPGATAGGTYLVQRPEAVMNVPYINLPANFTIAFASDVDAVNWTAGTFEFGVGATIDLTRTPRPTASPGSNGSDQQVQAGSGARGAMGGAAGGGAAGQSAPSFSLAVGQLGITGSLWIRTDGGNGGAGGSGGRGQTGGGSCCSGSGGHCGADTNAGPGGPGGHGGPGGLGGQTAVVTISAASLNPGNLLSPTACDSKCNVSTRPTNASGNDGTIAIWGAPGCGGSPGPGGPPGAGDMSTPQRTCHHGIHNVVVRGSGPGPQGDAGSTGALGSCGAATIRGPGLSDASAG
jgi:hypothetical protein